MRPYCEITLVRKTKEGVAVRSEVKLCKFCKCYHPNTEQYWYINKNVYLCKKKAKVSTTKEKVNNRYHIRIKEDVIFKLRNRLRGRFKSALKHNQKIGSAVRDLGCTIAELKVYLESKFQPGMSWDNYGRYGWHIDHIKPLSKFNLQDPGQIKISLHYSNLQPLWAKDNLKKAGK